MEWFAPPQESLTLSAGTVDTRAVTVESLPDNVKLEMSPAKDQSSISSCTTFAIVACLEYLVPGLRVSEAELFLRMITFGRDGRDNSGTCMRDYIPLLREGVIEESSFVPYENYNRYVRERWYRSRSEYREDLAYYETTRTYRFRSLNVKDPDNDDLPVCGEFDERACNLVFNGCHNPPLAKENQMSASEDFKESFEDVVQHIRRTSSRSLPVSIKPIWKTGMFPIKYRGLVECEYRDGYWRDQHFNCFPLMVKPNPGPFMSDSAFYLLKRILQTVPIVANVQIFIMPGAADHLWAKIIGSDSRIDLPPKQAIKKGNHAICLYGYDNSRQAFKFKNSWWVDDEEKIEAILKTPFIKWPKQWPKKPWGDDGSAWISYEYIRQHIVDAMVILPHPTEMWIDPDTSAKPQPNDKVVTAKFEEMLAAYKARRSSR